jgi:HSP20 family protein
MKKEQIQITLDENVLTVCAEREKKREKKRRKYHLSEIQYGAFSRCVVLPVEVNPEEVKTKFKRGVLVLKFKKTDRAQRQRQRICIEET